MVSDDKNARSDRDVEVGEKPQWGTEADARVFTLNSFLDSRGSLTVGEFPTGLPFEAKRFFVISQVPRQRIRGEHAHYKCEQFLVAIKGSVKVVLEASGQLKEYVLNSPYSGLYVPPMTWGVQKEFSEDCVLLVLASREFEEKDYIRIHEEFVKLQIRP